MCQNSAGPGVELEVAEIVVAVVEELGQELYQTWAEERLRISQSGRDMWLQDIREGAMAILGCLPACACPISLNTTPKPAGVKKPRFSVSAICQICYSVSSCFLESSFSEDSCTPLLHGAAYLTQDVGRQSRSLEELDGDIA